MKILMMSLLMSSLSALAVDRDGSVIFSVAGVLNDSVDEIGEDRNNDLNYGAGALVEFNIDDHFGIETGALLIERQYRLEAGPFSAVQKAKRVHIPVIARYWVSDYFSIGAGPFVSLRTGDVETSVSAGDTNLADFKTSADDDTEYGIDAAATLNFAVNDKTGLFVEGRYSSVFDQDNNEETNHASALAGLKFDL